MNSDIKVLEREHSAFDVSIDAWKRDKPHGISGLFRLKDEGQFMEAAILSHLPWLDEAVLLVQESKDNTIDKAVDLRNRFPSKIRIECYPFNVHPIGSQGHFDSPDNSVYTMTHLTNYGISMCRYSWVAKIEGDVIALPTFQLIKDLVDMFPNELHHYGRVGLNLAGPNLDMISMTNPRNAGWDESVFNNKPDFHCVKSGKWESINMSDFRNDPGVMYCPGFSFIHTKRCKVGKTPGLEAWAPFTEENIRKVLEAYGREHPYPGGDKDYCPAFIFDGDWRKYLPY